MSLTLEDVRRVRFRMSSRNVTGYRVEDVDGFIDKVEEAFAQFENERDLMRREAEATAGAEDGGDQFEELARKDAENEELRAEVESLQNQLASAPAAEGEPEGDSEASSQLVAQNEQLAAQNEELRAELDRVRAELDELRTQRVSEMAGSSEHITVGTREEASPAVVRLVQLATEQAEQLVFEADAEAQRKLQDAQQQAREITTDARTKGERIESEARVNAEQLRRDAEENANRMSAEAEARRDELFSDLEQEQGSLQGKVAALRDFEGSFRENMRGMLTKYLGELDQDHPQPGDVPELVQESDSETPRLDALAQDSPE